MPEPQEPTTTQTPVGDEGIDPNIAASLSTPDDGTEPATTVVPDPDTSLPVGDKTPAQTTTEPVLPAKPTEPVTPTEPVKPAEGETEPVKPAEPAATTVTYDPMWDYVKGQLHSEETPWEIPEAITTGKNTNNKT